jgi:molybdenum cofactor biosynthesis protein B
MLNLALFTISDTRTPETDTAGNWLYTHIHHHLNINNNNNINIIIKKIIKDDRYAIRAAVSHAIADDNIQVIITTGGTGITGRDCTPEAIEILLDKKLEGFGELFRHLSYAEIGAATLQSRALAGVANGTLIFVLPGSLGACQLAWEKILQSQLNPATKPCNFVQLLPRLREF